MQAGVITFPGSNCNRDMEDALSKFYSKVHRIWHKDRTLPENLDLIAIPGGFSYGDYLRCGSLAAHSSIMDEVIKYARAGGRVLGVCNGFQILTEAGLLPGVLLRNKNIKFLSKRSDLKIINKNTVFTKSIISDTINIPIAHHDGNFFCSQDDLKSIEDNDQIAFKYADNPNGSISDIAGITNKHKNILGMMPHPERAVDVHIGGTDGLKLFESLLN